MLENFWTTALLRLKRNRMIYKVDQDVYVLFGLELHGYVKKGGGEKGFPALSGCVCKLPFCAYG